MKRIVIKIILALGLGMGLTISGCLSFLPIDRSSQEAEHKAKLPQSYSTSAPSAEPQQQWWKAFNSTELNGLVEQALSESLTLRASWARFNQVKALAVKRRR